MAQHLGTNAVTTALWIFSALCAAGIGFSMLRGRLRESAP